MHKVSFRPADCLVFLCIGDDEDGAELDEIIARGEAIWRAVPAREEVEEAINRGLETGILESVGSKWRFTSTIRPKVHTLLSSNPPLDIARKAIHSFLSDRTTANAVSLRHTISKYEFEKASLRSKSKIGRMLELADKMLTPEQKENLAEKVKGVVTEAAPALKNLTLSVSDTAGKSPEPLSVQPTAKDLQEVFEQFKTAPYLHVQISRGNGDNIEIIRDPANPLGYTVRCRDGGKELTTERPVTDIRKISEILLPYLVGFPSWKHKLKWIAS